MKKNVKIQYDGFIESVRPDNSETTPLILLTGYIGKSSEKGHIRVYTDVALNNFVEIPEDAILHAEKLDKEASPMGGSRLWVNGESAYTYGDPKKANRPKSTFLEGDLMSNYFRNAPQPGFKIPEGIPPAFCGHSVTRFCGWNDNPTLPCNNGFTQICRVGGNPTIDYCRILTTQNPCGIVGTDSCNILGTRNPCGIRGTDNCNILGTMNPCGIVGTDSCNILGTRNPCGITGTNGCGPNFSLVPPTTWRDTVIDPIGGLGGNLGFQNYNPIR